ncbi:MFS transporter [Sphaerisporangium aureirubrum]|uniref:MFS transporter n=1 Tax=Sphaerisporangium aureirubrum TaxID=1544736 RepID=A0ABW1NU61_9ACTN
MTTVQAPETTGLVEPFPSPGFRALWAATGVSQVGSAVSIVAIPLVAAVTLRATPAQMAWLGVVELVPSLLVRVPAAAYSDRLRRPRVPVMVACNLLQTGIVGLIPLLWWLGALDLTVLLLLAGTASAALGVYSSLSSPLLVSVVPEPHLVTANGRLFATRSAADITGPAIGGGLLAVLSAPLVVLADALSFLLSAALLTRVRERPPEARDAAAGAPREGAAAVPRLALALIRRSSVQALVAVAVANGMTQAVLVLFLLRELRMHPSALGVLLAFGAAGGVGGGLLVGRLMARFGPGRTMAIGAVTTMGSLALLPFAAPGVSGAAGLVLFELGGSFGGTLMMATLYGGLQAAAPRDRVARVMALSGVMLQVAALCGVSLGGVAGTALGLRTAMVAVFGLMLAGLVPQLVRWAVARWAVDPAELR